MDAVCLLALYSIMNGVGGIEGILRADAEGCIRFVASLLKERNGMLDDRWTGKVTPMVSRSSSFSVVANKQVERVRGISKKVPLNPSSKVSLHPTKRALTVGKHPASCLDDPLISRQRSLWRLAYSYLAVRKSPRQDPQGYTARNHSFERAFRPDRKRTGEPISSLQN
jgi:hypothetical protein